MKSQFLKIQQALRNLLRLNQSQQEENLQAQSNTQPVGGISANEPLLQYKSAASSPNLLNTNNIADIVVENNLGVVKKASYIVSFILFATFLILIVLHYFINNNIDESMQRVSTYEEQINEDLSIYNSSRKLTARIDFLKKLEATSVDTSEFLDDVISVVNGRGQLGTMSIRVSEEFTDTEIRFELVSNNALLIAQMLNDFSNVENIKEVVLDTAEKNTLTNEYRVIISLQY